MTDRRAFLTAAPLAPVAIVAPAMAAISHDPIPEYISAFHGYDEDIPATVERHRKAAIALHEWEPGNAHDMLRKIAVTLDDNATPPETSMQLLIRQVDRLLEEKA